MAGAGRVRFRVRSGRGRFLGDLLLCPLALLLPGYLVSGPGPESSYIQNLIFASYCMIMVACAVGTILIPTFYFYLEKWTGGSEVTQPVGVRCALPGRTSGGVLSPGLGSHHPGTSYLGCRTVMPADP